MQEIKSDPYWLYVYSLKSPVTRERYTYRLGKFFCFLGIEGSIQERCNLFVEKAKDDAWLMDGTMRFFQHQKERVERKEISGATVPNFLKCIKLFLEVNDIYYVSIAMKFDPITAKVSWDYYANGDSVEGWKTYASFAHSDPHVQTSFIVGKTYSVNCTCTVKYFQVGITSKYNIGHSGWRVDIYDLGWAPKATAGSTFITSAKTVQGDASWWDWWARWGSDWYYNAKATDYDCLVNNDRDQVKLSYTSSVSVGTGTKL